MTMSHHLKLGWGSGARARADSSCAREGGPAVVAGVFDPDALPAGPSSCRMVHRQRIRPAASAS